MNVAHLNTEYTRTHAYISLRMFGVLLHNMRQNSIIYVSVKKNSVVFYQMKKKVKTKNFTILSVKVQNVLENHLVNFLMCDLLFSIWPIHKCIGFELKMVDRYLRAIILKEPGSLPIHFSTENKIILLFSICENYFIHIHRIVQLLVTSFRS